MATSTVNIAFDKGLLREIDKTAKSESRSRSEMLREAARLYIERKQKWADIFSAFDRAQELDSLTESDIEIEIRNHRREKSSKQ